MDVERLKAILLEAKLRGSTYEQINEAEFLNYIQEQLKKQFFDSGTKYE